MVFTSKTKSMKKLYLASLVSALAFVGCSEEETFDSFVNDVKIEASIDNGSRVAFGSGGNFFWTINDAIGVTTTASKTTFTKMSIDNEGVGQATATFTGKYMAGSAEGYAVYPYNENHSLSGTELTYNFPTSYDYTIEDHDYFVTDGTGNSFNPPMWSAIEDGKVSFKHLGGVLCIKIADLPAGENQQLKLTATNKITGNFIADLADSNPVLTTTASDVDNVVTINYNNTEASTRVFYVPVPTGTYSKLTVEFTVDGEQIKLSYDNVVVFARLLKSLTIGEGNVSGGESPAINSEETLKEALTEGGNVVLAGEISNVSSLAISENTVIDLNGNNLSLADKTSITVAEGKTLTIKDSQTPSTYARSTAASASITGSGDIITAGINSTIIIGEGVNITSTENCCIFIPKDVTGATITTAGNLTSQGGYAAIQANAHAENVVVNINGGTIKSVCEGVYFPCTTNLNISGGTIEGTTAVYHKSGTLNITGGTLKGTGAKADYVHNGNGCNATGDALVVEACDYPGGVPVVTISGGEFISTNAKAIGYYQQSEDYKLANENFISGGTFSDASAFEYLANNANVTLGADVTITQAIKIEEGVTATINLGSYDVTAPSTDAFEVLGSLTINGEDDAIVYAGSTQSETGSVCAVWANGGNVVINGGYYKVGPDSNSDRNDCIYAKKSSQVTINGGKFEYTGESSDENEKDGDLFLLNCDDNSSAKITVNGGTFKNHAPGYEPVAPSGYTEVVLGEGKAVYNGENAVTVAHSGNSDIWYTVK